MFLCRQFDFGLHELARADSKQRVLEGELQAVEEQLAARRLPIPRLTVSSCVPPWPG